MLLTTLTVAFDGQHVVKRFFTPRARPAFGADAGAVRISAIDFAHRQFRHLVLTERAYLAAHSAEPILKDIKLATGTTFADLGVGESLIEVLAARGISHPFPIQIETLPDTLGGRDVLGRGKTGSGKTLAFSLPMVSRLAGRPRRPARPTGLVLAPTRELASQITATLQPLAAVNGLRVTTIFGGVPQGRQVTALNSGVDIVVACSGRLEDLMKQRLISLDSIEITVIDEADHMADLGFLPGVTRILAATPSGGQRLLFSATLDNGVDKLVNRFLHDAVLHSVDSSDSPVPQMVRHVFHVSGAAAKKDLVHRLASGTGRRILFMRTKHQARKLAKQLTESGVPAVDLHGNLSQPARDRNLAAFSKGEARVLVATDIAARGVHVDGIELVVHIDPPAEHKAYLHRSGRTARAGNAGDVVTVVLPEQRKDTHALMRRAGIRVTPQEVTADSAAVHELVGDIAPYQAPAPKQVAAPKKAGAPKRGAAPKKGAAPRNGAAPHGSPRPRSAGSGSLRRGPRPGRMRQETS
ncbi:DEAD/DEAH box helicase [Mycobacterium ulcerans]|uniref:DEAD/DEAH box helicase n=1 Tax=Mycobacterium ulcerans TaxID=1809 RepID=UPI0012DDAC08